MRIAVLASGSQGNATLINSGTKSILFDAGISARKILTYFDELELHTSTLKAILITHEHSDHIRGIGPLARKLKVPVFCTEQTWNKAHHSIGNIEQVEFIEAGRDVTIENFLIKPFSIPHDAEDPLGFTIEQNGCKIGIATDVGYPTNLIRQRLQGCRLIQLEFNYNRELLIAGTYTWPMKQRIMSKRGHLSNEDACILLEDLLSDELEHIILAHMSENNNLPELAMMCVQDLLVRSGKEHITCTPGSQRKRTDWITLQ